MAMTPEARREAARKAVATRRLRLTGLPPPPEKKIPKTAARCGPCERNGWAVLWKCTGCRKRFCEHGMDPYQMRVNGEGLCRRCAWKAEAPEVVNARLVKMGLTPLDLKPKPEPAVFTNAA